MTNVSMKLTQACMKAILSGDCHLLDDPITAVLLSPAYSFENTHRQYVDIKAFSLRSSDYQPTQLNGKRVFDPASFISDPINFGNPVTIGPVGAVALVKAFPKALKDTSLLLAVGNFINSGSPVESIRGPFILTPSPSGWFTFSQP
ncbi:hypothetical protein [Kordiimonas laminariae]|uniref:hypothetical protein n=1 Tax=Kordiimonas laminariae TaxID=2917717 RepID=UPI001FF1E8E5|nr:hypothetical protein [Kordiimonas laminariae]MCK0068043.1 hypothetical protein [Kordiimonas laminariae]